ncbi:BZ3500_MvSof-1268-A1-R1_Chr6-3g08791 [Microbotryum saponariae]|uniref:BZ3500_MvSof-1268-A1-R1_Chr6-3g08791 protein n=1 Tax=Microbotryum saponariae TaxID=289078 RepID=A0A2X0NHR8_9BASI|nr:BZ3500_MvSof-1268-A1-R1_Chr6-3g08791 [Microbotryum saponariae]SDA07392.1 BZ3501_MvSof-1269-A2-R1_Chr6-2g08494 [Microbotryum saponariae]
MITGMDDDGNIYVTSFEEDEQEETRPSSRQPLRWTQSHRLEDALDLRLFGFRKGILHGGVSRGEYEEYGETGASRGSEDGFVM